MICAPSCAACFTRRAPLATFSSVLSLKCIWIRAAFACMCSSRLSLRGYVGGGRDDLAAVDLDHALGVLERRVEVELGHAEPLEPAQLLGALRGGAEDGEAVDDLVGHVARVLGTAARVLAVVVRRALLDVGAQFLRDLGLVVVAEQVDDVVPDERPEP